MDTQAIKKPLNQFINALSSKVKPEKLIIFGSYSEGTAKDDSDIDVIVVSNSFRNMDEDARLDVLYRASRFIAPDIHPWGVTKEELNRANKQSTLGYARFYGKHFF